MAATRAVASLLLLASVTALAPAPRRPAATARRAAAGGEPASLEDRVAGLEDRVVASVRASLDAGAGRPRAALSALGGAANASGALLRAWLTPQTMEACALFWAGGAATAGRDLARGRWVAAPRAAAAECGYLALLSLAPVVGFPWTPLFLPLLDRALDGAVAVPSAFGAPRLAALARLRARQRRADAAGHPAAHHPAIADGDDARATPQNVEESARFFADGGRVLWRDLRRGRVFANGDTPACYAWFALLSFSTFPLTPLLLPVIDVRRPGGRRCDYVPSCFRARRLAAFARLKSRSCE